MFNNRTIGTIAIGGLTVCVACSGLHPVGSRIKSPDSGQKILLAYSELPETCDYVGEIAAHRRGVTNPTDVVQVLYEQATAIEGDTFLVTRDDLAGWGSTTYADVYRCKHNSATATEESTANPNRPD